MGESVVLDKLEAEENGGCSCEAEDGHYADAVAVCQVS